VRRGATDCQAIFSGFVGRVKRGDVDLLIRQGLLSKLLGRTGEGLLNLKDLLTLFPASGRATFSGLVGRLKRGEAYLLIPQWLLAKWLSRIGEGLLNLKDLPTAFPPRLKGLFENEHVLRRSLATKSYQILPFSTKNVPRTGLNRQVNGGFSRPILLKGFSPVARVKLLLYWWPVDSRR